MRTDREDRNEERVKWEEEGKWKRRYIENKLQSRLPIIPIGPIRKLTCSELGEVESMELTSLMEIWTSSPFSLLASTMRQAGSKSIPGRSGRPAVTFLGLNSIRPSKIITPPKARSLNSRRRFFRSFLRSKVL